MDAALRLLILLCKLTGILIACAAIGRLLAGYAAQLPVRRPGQLRPVRNRFMQGMLLAFEVLLAAGILASALHPSWSDIGKLAAIASLRTLIKLGLSHTAGQGAP